MTHATLATSKMRLCKMVFARLRSCLLHPTMWQSYNTCRGNSTATVHITHFAQEWWWQRHMKLSACQKVSVLLPLYYHSTTTTIYYYHSTATIMQKMSVIQRKRFWKPSWLASEQARLEHLATLLRKVAKRFASSRGGPCSKNVASGARSSKMSRNDVARDSMTYICSQ